MIELLSRNAGWKLFSLLVSLLLWFAFARDPEDVLVRRLAAAFVRPNDHRVFAVEVAERPPSRASPVRPATRSRRPTRTVPLPHLPL